MGCGKSTLHLPAPSPTADYPSPESIQLFTHRPTAGAVFVSKLDTLLRFLQLRQRWRIENARIKEIAVVQQSIVPCIWGDHRYLGVYILYLFLLHQEVLKL